MRALHEFAARGGARCASGEAGKGSAVQESFSQFNLISRDTIDGVLPRSGFPQKIEKLLCRVFFPFHSLSKSQWF